ncbi:esterase/lipase family protein [Sandaracinus amylolyticus]|uniref:esterase/lipase family protein n=1 Tax=Sandaracinus amylolyticus TaxID=927083 RepID=UPI0012ED9579|nr:alpha/beta fold hydrolase [Sandaracinus amylolyticus]
MARGWVLVALLLASCGSLQRAREDIDARAQLALVAGRVRVEEGNGAPVVVALLRAPAREGCPYEVVDRRQVFGREGGYEMLAEPGAYRLVAFEDTSRDLEYSPGERIVAWHDFEDLELTPRFHPGIDLELSGLAPRFEPAITTAPAPSGLSVGEVRTLDDARFAPEVARVGIWEPLRFLRESGAGVYFLEPYDASRTPVLFVHGMGGHPREFASMIARLDRRTHQAWVAFYPSGWDLESIASYLHRAMSEAHTRTRFERLCVVAHSMGGVIARRALAMHARQREDPTRSFVRGLVTIASPLGGHPGAAQGVVLSPVVIDSWRSLVPASLFLRDLYEVPLPAETRYALLFAYRAGQSDDGVVPIASQLRAEAQDEAQFVRGYEDTHTGVLQNERVWAAVEQELESCRESE